PIDDPLGTNGTFPTGINDAGQIVGYYRDSTFREHGFLYIGGVFTTLDDPLGSNGLGTEILDINNVGQIVGTYRDSTGVNQGFSPTVMPVLPPPLGTTADMILRHVVDGKYEIYDIGNNAILAAYPLGQVGTNWQFFGLCGFFGNDTTDMLLRNSTTGGF